MDVFTLLKFWRTTAGSDPPPAGDFVSSIDDDESFFDLVFTSSGDGSRSSFSFSSPDSVFFNSKKRILPLDSPNTKTKTKTPQSPLRLLKLGFQNSQNNQNNQKLKPEKKTSEEIEEVKIGALLKRDNSLRNRLRTEKLLERDQVSSKRFSKEVFNKYLNRMKPNSLNVSKRSTEKSRLSDSSLTPSSSPASSVFSPRNDERKSGSRTVFGGVRKHLGKSRSSAIVQSQARKSDDSALEQQDGIQRAILHCKRSFNSPYQDSMLSRSGSAPSNNQARVSVEEQKRSSI